MALDLGPSGLSKNIQNSTWQVQRLVRLVSGIFFYTHWKDSVVSKGRLHSVAFGTYYGRTRDH